MKKNENSFRKTAFFECECEGSGQVILGVTPRLATLKARLMMGQESFFLSLLGYIEI